MFSRPFKPGLPTPSNIVACADGKKEEAVRENLKNVVLFMASSGYLVPPARDPSKKELWEETWKRLNRFAPDLQSDLLLEDSEQVPAMEPQEVQEGVIDEASGEEVAENGVAQSGADA